MFKDNLVSVRKMHGFSQDELAEKIGVSRQTLSKYETGESLPDIERCKLLAEVLDVSLDELVNYDRENINNLGLGVPPKGKHVFGITKVGEKGQIVIPAKARKIFDIQPGDNLIILGDESQGIAIIKENVLSIFFKGHIDMHSRTVYICNWLWHKGRIQSMSFCNGLYNHLKCHDIICCY